jgi:hypothetical protein
MHSPLEVSLNPSAATSLRSTLI